jgi:hypothetical protein
MRSLEDLPLDRARVKREQLERELRKRARKTARGLATRRNRPRWSQPL